MGQFTVLVFIRANPRRPRFVVVCSGDVDIAGVVMVQNRRYADPDSFRSRAVNLVDFPAGRSRSLLAYCSTLAVLFVVAAIPGVRADDKPTKDETFKDRPAQAANEGDLVPLNKEATVLLDKKGKRVLLKTHVALRQGSLEMLCCLKQTKEHESIVSLDAKAYVVHTGLIAIDAKPGTPVQYNPEFQAPTGQKIDIFVNWTDENGKSQRVRAQNWVRQSINRFRIVKMESLPEGVVIPKNSELRYDRKLKELSWYGQMTAKQKQEFLGLSNDKDFREAIEKFYVQSQPREMKADWVFAGSGFFTDEDTGKKFYLAEDGDLICVANFGGAMIDVAMPSSAESSELNFEAFTERIPPKGTPVTVELIPVVAEEKTPPKK